MQLEPDDLRLFYKLYPALLSFVNQRLGIVDTRFTGPEEYGALPTDQRIQLRNALVANLGLIEAFVSENPARLSADELEIVGSWKDLVAGEFYVYRILTKYTVFLTTREPAVAYGVLHLRDSFEDMLGPRLPHLCKTVLLPFKGQIVYDGLLAGYRVTFGPGLRRRFKESYNQAKNLQGIVTSLPPAAWRPPPIGGEPTTRRQAASPRAKGGKSSTSAAAAPAYEAIVGLIDAFCREHLDEDYRTLCRKLAGILARKRPSPLTRGKPESWASGIVRTIGWVNFLGDPSQPHHMKMADVDKAFGVSEATGSAKTAAIRKLVKIRPFDPEWMLPARMEANPLTWMLQVNGLITDIRLCPREAQVVAFENGLIPYIPADREADTADE
jgi:hypothetical protein